MRIRGKSALGYLAVWTFIALLFAGQSLLYSWQEGRRFTAAVALISSLQYWYIWAVVGVPVIWFTHRFPLTRSNWPARAAVHLAVATLCATSHVFLRAATGVALWGDGFEFWKIFVEQFHLNVFVYAAIVGVTHAWIYHNAAVHEAASAAQLTASLSEARLESLSAQLEPHFLFNTLQTASSLVYSNAADAERVLLQLSELLRRALRVRTQQFSTLADELDFVDRYVDILRARFGDRLQFSAAIDPALLNARVPSLLLQPLIENAVKHGITKRPGLGRIELTAILGDRDQLVLSIGDDGPGFADHVHQDGVGLQNTRERLAHLYGDRHTMNLDTAPAGGLVVRISIPLTT
jgi:two-component system, LytTR family, sensor kinase